MTQVIQGGPPVKLYIEYTDADDNPIDPPDPKVSVFNPSLVAVVTDAVPVRESLGAFYLLFAADDDAPLGSNWSYVATGTIGGFLEEASDFFEVVAGSATGWVTGADIQGDRRLADVDLPPGVTLDMCARGATSFLFKASGRRYRTFTHTVRPNRLRPGCGCGFGGVGWPWVAMNGASATELVLPRPSMVQSVIVEGVTLDPSAYVLYDQSRLVRQDGLSWPCCQRLEWPLGQPGTWSVTYTHGQLPPVDGILACRELAIWMAQSLSGKTAKLPARTQSVSRQGTSITVGTGHAGTSRGRFNRADLTTGIPLVDNWVRSENPYGLQQRASVSSPDTIRRSALPS